MKSTVKKASMQEGINRYNMNLYKITIKPITSFCSPLQSDTFFGAFCWSYLYRYGESALQEMIFHCKAGKPDIIFSNAFPEGHLPMPVGVESSQKGTGLLSKQERYQIYIDNKERDHFSMIRLEDFNQIINCQYPILFRDADIADEYKIMSWRNMVSRQTGTVENADSESHLFEIDEIFTCENFDIYILSTLETEILCRTLEDMFFFGIGAQRSVGKGAFRILNGPKLFEGFKIPKNPNAFVALSNFIPHKGHPVKGFYEAFVKYPKIPYLSSEKDSPFKKPLIFIKAGSVFFDQTIMTFYGSCIENVALKNGKISDEIITGAYTIAVPCCIDFEM